MKYYFLPIESHSDLGFGATADSFRQSAEFLLKDFEKHKSILEKLPLCFLFRHSLELYLKSMIIVVHSGLKIPFAGESTRLDPKIIIGGKEKRLFSEHGLKRLFDYFQNLVTVHAEALSKVAATKWSEIPDDLVSAIKNIDDFDTKSSYFRYPISGREKVDNEKSSFKKIDFEQMIANTKIEGRRPVKAFVLVDENDNPIETFVYDDTSSMEILEDLKLSVEQLSAAHFGLRIELADGY